MAADEGHNVTHVRGVHGDAMAPALESVKHDAIEVDPFLRRCRVSVAAIDVAI